MLDLQISLPQIFLQALLSRLDKLLAILEYHFSLPQITERMRQPEPPPELRFHEVNDQSLWEAEAAVAHFRERTQKDPNPQEIDDEVGFLREEGVFPRHG